VDEGGTSSGHLSVPRSLTSSLKNAQAKRLVISTQIRNKRVEKIRTIAAREVRDYRKIKELEKIRPKDQEIFTLAGEGHGTN
jgi:hypothetical protein